MPARKNHKHVQCKMAAEFMNSISARGKYFVRDSPSQWIFRGQENEQWQLLPSAFRQGTALKTPYGWRQVGYTVGEWNNELQIQNEMKTLKAYFNFADAAGLPLPEDSQRLRLLLSDRHEREFIAQVGKGTQIWPPSDLWSLAALAQHYGIPTRLLDWTWNAFKAAYFAAKNVAKRLYENQDPSTNSTSIALWAYCIHSHILHEIIAPVTKRRHQVEIITAPYAGNPNLCAQEGIHTLYVPVAIDLGAKADRSSFDDELAYVHKGRGASRAPALYKFTLPNSETPKLMWLLAKERITAATLFPGYKGAAESLFEEQYWVK